MILQCIKHFNNTAAVYKKQRYCLYINPNSKIYSSCISYISYTNYIITILMGTDIKLRTKYVDCPPNTPGIFML